MAKCIALLSSRWAAASSTSSSTLHAPVLDRLPAGAIVPEGWLLKQAHVQANGETGGLAVWLGGGIAENCYMPFATGSVHAKCGMQGGEYFINGMFPLTAIIDVPALRDIRERSVGRILRWTNGPNGTLMGEIPWTNRTNDNSDYWGRMIAVLALQTYVESVGPYAPNATMKARVEAALVRHYYAMYSQMSAEMPPFYLDAWGSARYVEILIGIQWMLDRGHTDEMYFDLLRLVQGKSHQILGWEEWFRSGDPFADHTTDTIRCWGNKSDPTEREFQKHHGVNIMEAIKTGPVWSRVTGNASDLNNAEAALRFIDTNAYSSDGTMTAGDCLNVVVQPHDPTEGVETCAVVESMYSLRTSYEITGNPLFYDRLEHIAFNALPLTTAKDFSGNCYYHMMNQGALLPPPPPHAARSSF